MTRGDRWLGVLLGAALLFGCVTDHDALQKMPNGGAGAGGTLGTAGAPALAGGAGGAPASGGGHADDEAPGKSVFTIINGLVDAPSVVLCWAKVDEAGNATPFGTPLGGAPLAYGQSLSSSVVEGANLATESLQPFAIAGELELISGLACEAAVARAQDEEMAALGGNSAAASSAEAGAAGAAGEGGGGGRAGGSVQQRARLRVRGLPTISAGTLSAGFSVLYVSTGCLGGATYGAKDATEYCGPGYSEQSSTASAVLVVLSRKTQAGLTGLQFVHASLATDAVDVSSRPPFPSQAPGIQIVNDVVEGQAAPRPALLGNAASAYGIADMYHVQVSVQGAPVASYDWATVLQRGGLTTLSDGRTYALVLLGPRADHVADTLLWNASAVTAIAVDPE